jgi:Formin Homology 2 Domain/Subunit CCDC53 of WASH complex
MRLYNAPSSNQSTSLISPGGYKVSRDDHVHKTSSGKAHSIDTLSLKLPRNDEAFAFQEVSGNGWEDFSNLNGSKTRTAFGGDEASTDSTSAFLPTKIVKTQVISNDGFNRARESGIKTRNRIVLDPTASTTSSSGSVTAEISPAIKSPYSFHFDIDVVTSAEKGNVDSCGFEEDGCSKASSSTISTYSMLGRTSHGMYNHNLTLPSLSEETHCAPVVCKEASLGDAHNLFGAFPSRPFDDIEFNCANTDRSGVADGWTTPNFFHEKQLAREETIDDVLWTTFSHDSFTPIEKAPRNRKTSTTLASPKARRASSRNVRTNSASHDICEMQMRINQVEDDKEFPLSVSNFAGHKMTNSKRTAKISVKPSLQLFSKPVQDQYKKVDTRIASKSSGESLHFTSVPDCKVAVSDSSKIVDRDVIETRPRSRALSKLTGDSSFLNNMLRQKIGGESVVSSVATISDELNGRVTISPENLGKQPITVKPNCTVKSKTTRENSLLSQMLQNKVDRTGTSATSVVKKSVYDDSKSVRDDSKATRPAVMEQELTPEVMKISMSGTDSTGGSEEMSELEDLSDTEFATALNVNPDFAKYAKMIKVGLPIAVIKNAMQRDGIALTSKKVVKESSLNDVSPPDPIQRFRLHWTTHTNVRSNTVWAMIRRENHWLTDVVIEEEEMKSLFQKEKAPKKTAESSWTSSTEIEKGSSVIDPKRANNCGIILATIKLSYREIATAIDTINVHPLTLTQVHGISQFIPTPEEVVALQKQMDRYSDTTQSPFRVECEKFMVEMMRINNAKEKLDAISFMKRLPLCLKEFSNGKF